MIQKWNGIQATISVVVNCIPHSTVYTHYVGEMGTMLARWVKCFGKSIINFKRPVFSFGNWLNFDGCLSYWCDVSTFDILPK